MAGVLPRVERLLRPGGVFQLFLAHPTLPAVLSARGVRARLRHPCRALRTERARALLFDRRLREVLPPSLEVVERTEAAVPRGAGRGALEHVLIRKPGR